MAVYKPTFCSPYNGSFTLESSSGDLPIFIECQIDTSNTLVNGFSIQLFKEDGTKVFPDTEGFDVPEIPDGTVITSIKNFENFINTYSGSTPESCESHGGLNGTTLKFPFVWDDDILDAMIECDPEVFSERDNYSMAANIIRASALSYNTTYKWKITLYQLSADSEQQQTYTNPPDSRCFDNFVTSGTVLGSTNERLQALKSDKIFSDYYVQPVHIPGLNAGTGSGYNPRGWTKTGDITNVGSRALIESYDSTYGYIYPVTGSDGLQDQIIKYDGPNYTDTSIANGFQIYKMSNKSSDLNSYQKVDSVPHAIVPWTWHTSTENPGDSYGTQEYYISQSANKENDGLYYPFDVVKNADLLPDGFSQTLATSYPEGPRQNHSGGWVVSSSTTAGVVVMDPSVKNSQLSTASSGSTSNWSIVPKFLRSSFKGGEMGDYWVGLNSNKQIEVIFITRTTKNPPETYNFVCNATDSSGNVLANASTFYLVGPDNYCYPDDEPDKEISPKVVIKNGSTWYWGELTVVSGTSVKLIVTQVLGNSSAYTIIGHIRYGNFQDLNSPGDYTNKYFAFLQSKEESSSTHIVRIIQRLMYYNTSTSTWNQIDNGPTIYVEDDNMNAVDFVINSANYPEEHSPHCAVIYSKNDSYNVEVANIELNDDGTEYILRYELTLSDSSTYCYSVSDGIGNIMIATYSNVYVSHDSGHKWDSVYSCSSNEHVQTVDFIKYSVDSFVFSILHSDNTSSIYIMDCTQSWCGNGVAINSALNYCAENLHGITSIGYHSGWYIMFNAKSSTSTTMIPYVLKADTSYWQASNSKRLAIKASNSQRIVLNYQSASQTSHTDLLSSTGLGNYPSPNLSESGSAYNGIYFPTITTENTINDMVKVTINWNRVPDADTWGEISTKIVLVNFSAASGTSVAVDQQNISDFLGKNIQINFDDSASTAGVINSTPFKFIEEKPVEIFDYDDTDYHQTTGLIFYNHIDSNVGTLYIRPFTGLKAGSEFVMRNEVDKHFIISHVDNDSYYGTWFVNYTHASGMLWDTKLVIDESKYNIYNYFSTSDEYQFKTEKLPTLDIASAVVPFAGSVDLTGKYTYANDNFVSWKRYQWQLYSDSEYQNLIDVSNINTSKGLSARFMGLVPHTIGDVHYYGKLVTETNSGRIVEKTTDYTITGTSDDSRVWSTSGSATSDNWSISNDNSVAAVKVTLPTYIAGEQIGDDDVFNIYKCEYWTINSVDNYQPIDVPVMVNITGSQVKSANTFYDFNVGNGRTYEYIVYYTSSDTTYSKRIKVKACWVGVAISEISDISEISTFNSGISALKNTWRFKLNLSMGGETTNISHNMQDTLSKYPSFMYGPKQYISGSVSSLLGSGFCCGVNEPNEYVEQLNRTWGQSYRISNKPVDKLQAWREFCASPKPKLLRDDKGQILLVQISSSNNQVQNDWVGRPEEVSWDYTEIGDSQKMIVTSKLGG